MDILRNRGTNPLFVESRSLGGEEEADHHAKPANCLENTMFFMTLAPTIACFSHNKIV
jgi:hypothetical protein